MAPSPAPARAGAGLLLLLTATWALAQTSDELAAVEIANARQRLPALRVVPLRGNARALTLTREQSITVEELRGRTLDDAPPTLGDLAAPYDPDQTDGFAPGEAPYVARGVEPFRLRYFHCEFNYGGWHNLAMQDYAATHGFGILYPNARMDEQRGREPEGTRWLRWSGFVDWQQWLPKHGIAAGRYDLLVGRDLVSELLASDYLTGDDPAKWDCLMIDLEHPVLALEALRDQRWYPGDASGAERAAFEQRYYAGYALTITASIEAAARRGYRNISTYGWQPFERGWYGLETLRFDPEDYWQWETYGRAIYREPALAIINPSAYTFYWSPRNVAYTLAQVDLCQALLATEPVRKPVRPYYWTLLHGGGNDYRWWMRQPVATEDARAWTLLCFFAGVDGFDLWNWSYTGNHHRPRPFLRKDGDREVGADIMVKDAFAVRGEGAPAGEPATAFARYDAVHVVSYDQASGVVRFQRIERDSGSAKLGVTPDMPIHAMRDSDLTPHLRAESEPVAGVIEGMALAKPFEYLLRNGEVRVDVPSLTQFAETLPIVRRVQLGRWHVLATYNPMSVHGGAPRQIVLPDFDGHAGLTLTLPADDQARVFVLEER